MKNMGLLVLCSLAVFTCFAEQSFAIARRRVTLASVCPKVVGMKGYIYKNYQPLRRGPNDHTLVGYQRNPTLLDYGGGSRHGNATMYDGKGKSLGVCQGLQCDECKNHWRFKCSTSTVRARKAAVASTRSASIYFNVGGKCVKVPDAGKCVGSVKGLCTQTLK